MNNPSYSEALTTLANLKLKDKLNQEKINF
jgi:hypothetical protein